MKSNAPSHIGSVWCSAVRRSGIFVSLLLMMLLPNVGVAATLTIDQAVERALTSNQEYLIALGELDRAEAEVQHAVAGVLPDLTFNSRYTRQFKAPRVVFGGESFKIGTDNYLDLGLTLNQPIWQGGKVLTAITIARLYRLYTQAAVDEAKSEVVFAVRKAFLDAILAQNVVHVFADALQAAELNLEIVAKMESQGVVSEYERLRAEVEVANLRPQLTQSRNQAVLAEHLLKDLLSIKITEPIELVYSFEPMPVDPSLSESELYQSASIYRPALRQQEHVREITGKAINLARAEKSFKLDLHSSYGWVYQADDFGFSSNNWTPEWSASLLLSLPIFDGFSTRAQVSKAKVDYRAAQLSYEQLSEQVQLQVREALLLYEEASERLAAQSKTIAQATEGLRIAQIRYQNGVGTQLEILSAQSALTQARTNFVQAQHDVDLAIYRLLRATGADTIVQLKEQ